MLYTVHDAHQYRALHVFYLLLPPLCPQAVPVSSSVLHGTETGPAGDGGHWCQLACVPVSS